MKIEHPIFIFKDRRFVFEFEETCAMLYELKDDKNWWWIVNKSDFMHPWLSVRDALMEAAHGTDDPYIMAWMTGSNPQRKHSH